MKVLRGATAVLTIILLSACQPRTETNGGPKAPQPSYTCPEGVTGLDCLKFACSDAGGVFSEELKKCSCGVGKSFVIDKNGPQCRMNQIENACLEKANGFQLSLADPGNTDDCFVFYDKRINGYTRTLGILLDDANQHEHETLARWADTSFKTEFSYQFWSSSVVPSYQLIWLGGTISNPQISNGFLIPYELPDELIDDFDYFISPKYFTTADELIRYLSGKTEKTDTREIRSRIGNEHTALSALLSAYEKLSAKTLKFSVNSYYKEECLRSCSARSEEGDWGRFKVWFENFYFSGALYRSELRLADRETGLILATLLLADRTISVAIDFKRSETGLLEAATAFGSKGNVVFTRKGPDAAEILAELDELKSIQIANLNLKIGLCEEGLSLPALRKKGLKGAILLGPNVESFYGWVTPKNRDDYWIGRLDLNIFGLSFPRDRHALQTASVLLEPKSDALTIGLIPLGVAPCLNSEYAGLWWNSFKESGARVVNASIRNYSDRETCEEKLQNHPIMNDDSVLWVFAAGNQGSPTPTGCPQHFAGLPNLLIVGANQGNRMHPTSNFGESFVDIAAPGEALVDAEWGTSFSAPRASRLAAKIFYRFPKLSPKDVKRAIILGADIPPNPLPVLSKGILNEKKAEEIAEGLASGRDIKAILESAFCQPSGTATCPILRTKLEINSKLK